MGTVAIGGMPSYAINDVNEVEVCTGGLQPGPQSIRGIVFSVEEYDASDFTFLKVNRPQSTGRDNRRDTNRNLRLPPARIASNDAHLAACDAAWPEPTRSEEHTSELQSLRH